MVPITAHIGKDTLGMENHAKVHHITSSKEQGTSPPNLSPYFLFFLFSYRFVSHLCSQMSMNATIKAMFVKLMQTLPKLLPIIIRCVRKDTLGNDSRAKVLISRLGKAKQDFHVYYCHIGSESMQVFFPLKVATFVTLTRTVHMLMAPRTASVREDTLAMDSHAEVP